MCENDVFVLPVNILTGVARRLLGPHDTLPCVLIYIYIYIYLIKNSQAVKKGAAPKKGHGEKRCEIQGGGQEMAVMVG